MLVYILIMLAALYTVFVVPTQLEKRGYACEHFVACDFRIYYEAADGNYSWADNFDWKKYNGLVGYLYPKWTAILWRPFLLLDFSSAYMVWVAILTGAYLLLARRLMNEKWGWIVVLAGIKPLMLCVQSGNVIPLVALAMASPFGCLLGGMFKLWPLAGIGLHFLVGITSRHARTSG